MNYFEVIPLIKISLSRKPYFTYKSKENLSKGDLVSIDFRNKTTKGVVYRKTKKPVFYTKPIKKVLEKDALSEHQWKLAKEISRFYFTPLGIVLKLFIPMLTKNRSKIREKNNAMEKTEEKITLTPKQKEAAERIKKAPSGKFLLFGPASSGKTEVIMKSIENNLKKNRQSLVLLPEIFLSHQEIERYQKRFKKRKVALLHSGLKNSEKTSIWQRIKNGEVDILISTKIGCFYPFKNLGFIAVEEEQDVSHKQWDKAPYYHTRWTAEKISDIHQSGLVFSSATPSPEVYQKALDKKISLLKLPMLNKKNLKAKKPEIELADLRKNFQKSKTGFIFSTEITEALKKTVQLNKTGIIMVPGRGKSKAVMCSDCKKILKCPNCSTSLISVKDKFKCLHCSYKTSSLSQCPKCKSFRLVNIGFGTESVAEELQNLFPKSRIAVIDRTTLEKKEAREMIFKDFYTGKLDLLVGTQVISKGFDLKNLAMTGILNADKWMGKSDFRFDERWLGGIFQLSGRVNRPDKNNENESGKSIIQTYQPENPLLKHLKEWNWKAFLEEELEKRKALSYPPFGAIYKLTYKDKNKELVEKNVNKVYNQIIKITEKDKEVDVLEPYYSNIEFVRNRRIKNVLIKTQKPISDNSKLGNYLIKISDDWAINPDPENIF
ncbi:MAG: primosomal protein N' [Candidatus Moraniibacteriota bacterium]